ncbi:MAG TPA: serine/threonine-protein kinase, partial [bacterium]|nr:serine/threonine-protein kinase [bacterium]
MAINPEVANRFKNEAVITAKLTGNPYIIKVYDYGYKERIHYIITMFLSGRSLRDEMKYRFTQNQKFDWREAAEIMVKVGKALESVHAREVVHRDIKPGNIIFENGQPILIDFGIAKIPQKEQGKEWQVMTQAGMSLGTPHYISPEEAQGLGSTPKSDIYSLGVVFYEMVTGRVPFDGESAQAIMIDHVTKEPDDPTIYNSSLPSHIAQVVLKLLRKDPNQRLSASEMVATLEELLGIGQRGSSASAQSVAAPDAGTGGGHAHTVMTKNVLKTKVPGKQSGVSPLTLVLILLIAGGAAYALMPSQQAAPVQEETDNGGATDPLTDEMSRLYDVAGLDLQKGLYKKAESEYEKVYLWNPTWREVSIRYQAVQDFLEGKKAYLSGRSRTSFEKAIQYFDKANKALNGKFPMASEYKAAAQHMSDAIGAEQAAEAAENKMPSAPNAQMKAQYHDQMLEALWDSQRSYEKVTEQIPYEAGAYLSRLAVLEKYLAKVLEKKDEVQ